MRGLVRFVAVALVMLGVTAVDTGIASAVD